MSEIVNENEVKLTGRPTVVRNATDLQRLKLEKLMKHPEKPILIPEKLKERGIPAVPEFVRNVMGSSAGAGSGEFHVYRHLRRKEYARQKFMKERGERERLEDEYHEKLEDYKRKAEEKTAKKRAKRLKRKGKKGNNKKTVKQEKSSESEESESENDECEEESLNTNVSELSEEPSDKKDNKESSGVNVLEPHADSKVDEAVLTTVKAEDDSEAASTTENVTKSNSLEVE